MKLRVVHPHLVTGCAPSCGFPNSWVPRTCALATFVLHVRCAHARRLRRWRLDCGPLSPGVCALVSRQSARRSGGTCCVASVGLPTSPRTSSSYLRSPTLQPAAARAFPSAHLFRLPVRASCGIAVAFCLACSRSNLLDHVPRHVLQQSFGVPALHHVGVCTPALCHLNRAGLAGPGPCTFLACLRGNRVGASFASGGRNDQTNTPAG